MRKHEKTYEPPTMKIYQFDDNDQVLTSSGGTSGGGTTDEPEKTADYAARALNDFFGGTNTTIE